MSLTLDAPIQTDGPDITQADEVPSVAASFLYGVTLTEAEKSILRTRLSPALDDWAEGGQFFVFAGDSLSDTTWSAAQGSIGAGNNWNQKLMNYAPLAGRGTAVYTAVQSRKIADLIAGYATEVYPYRPGGASGPAAGKKSFLFVLICINDIGVTALGTMKTTWDSYTSTARADGFTVVAFTVTKKTSFSAASIVSTNDFNNYIRVSPNWDYLVDSALALPDSTDTSKSYDGTHWTPAHHAWLARHVAATMYSRYQPNPLPWDVGTLNVVGIATAATITVSGTASVVGGFTTALVGTADVTGGASGRGTIEAIAANPVLSITKTGGGTNQKIWGWDARTNGSLLLVGTDDARTASTTILTITRSGTAGTGFTLASGVVFTASNTTAATTTTAAAIITPGGIAAAKNLLAGGDATSGASGRGTIEAAAAQPTTNITKTNASADQGVWAWDGRTDGALSLVTVNDARSASATVLTITRSGTTPTDLTFNLPLVFRPAAAVTPASNGDLVIEKTSNTSLTFKLKGSDGVVRTAVLALG